MKLDLESLFFVQELNLAATTDGLLLSRLLIHPLLPSIYVSGYVRAFGEVLPQSNETANRYVGWLLSKIPPRKLRRARMSNKLVWGAQESKLSRRQAMASKP